MVWKWVWIFITDGPTPGIVIKTNANHVFVFSTSNGLTETWKYQSKYKQFELNYQIDLADS